MFGGLDTGLTVHFVGQYWDNAQFTANFQDRKVREWTTVDWILSYTFNSRVNSPSAEISGYTKSSDSGSATKEKNLSPVSTAEYRPCGWRSWLNNTTITLGINNITDQPPPFVAAAFENGYDESTANIRGRTWYVALKKRF